MTGTSLSCVGDDVLDHADVGGGAHKRKRDHIDAVVESEFQIFAVFFCQGRDRERGAGKVDAFVLAQHAAIDDVAQDVFAADSATRSSIRPSLSRMRAPGDSSRARSGNVVEIRVAVPATFCGVMVTTVPVFRRTGSWPLQRSGADLRALQILQDADGAGFAIGGAAQAGDVAGVVLVGAVGEVEARDVHAEAKQVAHGGFGVAGGADGADDFGAARRRTGGQSSAGSGRRTRRDLAHQILSNRPSTFPSLGDAPKSVGT